VASLQINREPISFILSYTLTNQSQEKKMIVTNSSAREIKVAINHWGKDGSTDYFTIPSGGKESWDRSDERGFVMVVKKGGSQLPYYIYFDSEIIVHDDKVTDKGSEIPPAN
jgi:hypothetical protein